MKMLAYNVRSDEKPFFDKFASQYKLEIQTTTEIPNTTNAALAEGADCVSVITTSITSQIIDAWKACGVRAISTRTIGFEHVDYRYAASLGIPVSNVTYTANTVAEYTVMMMLMAIRKVKAILIRYAGGDYSLSEVQGREMKNLTVGVVGTGRIGAAVVRILQGFGCRILAYDLCPSEKLQGIVEYTDLSRLFAQSDVITFHAPATEDTFHMVNAQTLAGVKDGVVLVNTARGTLMDTDAVIQALEDGKIGAAAFDVIEGEMPLYYKDYKYKQIHNRGLQILAAMPNVVMMPHTAFFTDQAVSDQVEHSIVNCLKDLAGESDPFCVNAAELR